MQPSYLKKTEEIWKNNIKFTKSKWTKYILLQPVCFSAVYPINVDSSRVAVSNVFEYLFFSLKQLKDNLTIAYEKMNVFSSPLYMALSYEENQGPLHNSVAQMLWDISTDINATSVMLIREVTKFWFELNYNFFEVSQRRNIFFAGQERDTSLKWLILK